MKTTEQTTLQAFLIALAQLETPLSEEVTQDIHEIAVDLETNKTNTSATLAKIPSVVNQDSQLNQLYQTARLNLKSQYQAQERDKFDVASFGINSASTLSLDNTSSIENIALEILRSHNFQAKAQQIVDKLQDSQDAFIKTLEMALSATKAKADIKALNVLEALEFRPLTVENLAYSLEIDQEQVERTVQRLWQERKIDTTRGNTLHKILPFLRSPKQPCKIDPANTYLTLTSLGYFHLHPVIQVA